MNVRLSSALGALAVVLGLAMVFARGLAEGVSAEWALVVLVGVLAAIQGLRFAQARRAVDLAETETDDPEKRYEAPTPGDDVGRSLAVAQRWSRAGRNTRRTLRQRLGEAAVTAVMDEYGCSREEAARRIRTGEWTDDPVAAAFLSRELSLSPRERGRLLLRSRSPLSQFATSFASGVRAVAAVSDVEVDAVRREVTDS